VSALQAELFGAACLAVERLIDTPAAASEHCDP
jgi:hypothetical protein